MRVLFSVGILAVSIGWIVLSYLPIGADLLPQFQFAPDGMVRVFPALMIAGFLAFVALQVWVVQTTAASIRRYETAIVEGSSSDFRLSVSKEAFLTAVPIAFTVLLGIASYGWWQRLTALN